MGEPHYTAAAIPRRVTPSSSRKIRDEFEAIEAGIDEMDKQMLTVYLASIEDEEFRYFAMPFALQIDRVIAIGNVLDAGSNASLNTFENFTQDVAILLDKVQPTVISLGSGTPDGDVYPGADANVSSGGAFAAGEVCRIRGSCAGAGPVTATLGLQVSRTG